MNFPARSLVTCTLLLTFLAGCGSSEQTDGAPRTSGSASSPADSTAAVPATPAAPTYRMLSKKELTKTLVSLRTLPAGYSQDPPDRSNDANKTFCDYKPPFTEKVKVGRDFTKGAGMSAELLSVGIRQYAGPEEAKAAFDALTAALASCKGETYQGSKMVYAPMSAPKVGDASVGVKITADGIALLQTFALVGPTMINAGGGGLMNASAEDVNAALKAQVKAYKAATAN